jgi:hypothetical protein
MVHALEGPKQGLGGTSPPKSMVLKRPCVEQALGDKQE